MSFLRVPLVQNQILVDDVDKSVLTCYDCGVLIRKRLVKKKLDFRCRFLLQRLQ